MLARYGPGRQKSGFDRANLVIRSSLHDCMLQFVTMDPEKIGAKYHAAKKSNKSAGIITRQPLLGTTTANKAFKEYYKAAKNDLLG